MKPVHACHVLYVTEIREFVSCCVRFLLPVFPLGSAEFLCVAIISFHCPAVFCCMNRSVLSPIYWWAFGCWHLVAIASKAAMNMQGYVSWSTWACVHMKRPSLPDTLHSPLCRQSGIHICVALFGDSVTSMFYCPVRLASCRQHSFMTKLYLRKFCNRVEQTVPPYHSPKIA